MNKTALYITCALTAVGIAALGQSQQYRSGGPATPEEVRDLDISLPPMALAYPRDAARSYRTAYV